MANETRATGIFSSAMLLDIWEARAGRVLRAFGLDSVRTTILTLSVMATLIPALATGFISYRQNSRAIRAKLDEQLTGVSTQAAREMGIWLKERQYDLRVFSTSYEVTDNVERATPQTRARLADYLGAVKQRFPDFDEMMVVSPDKQLVASSAATPGQLSLSGDWLPQARLGESVLGVPTHGDSATTMEIAVPITGPSGRFLGVLAGRLNLRGIEQILKDQLKGREDRVVIVRADGEVIVTGGGAHSAMNAASLRELEGAESTAVAFQNSGGTSVLGASSPVPRTDWIAVAELPAEDAYREIRQLRNATILLVVVLLIVVGSLAYTLGLLIVQPLDRLRLAADRVAGGRLDVHVPASGGGELVQLTTVFNDMVRRLRDGREELERLSVTDELTGLANRRRMRAELEREVVRSGRHGHPFAVVMLDVDRFKHFNDTYGHPAGDAVLKRMAVSVRACVRDLDTVARYGGEEFMVILPETPESEAARVAERVRTAAEKDRFSPIVGSPEVSVTFSIGYALYPEHGETADELIEAADLALYRSKEAGRNRVTPAKRGSRASS